MEPIVDFLNKPESPVITQSRNSVDNELRCNYNDSPDERLNNNWQKPEPLKRPQGAQECDVSDRVSFPRPKSFDFQRPKVPDGGWGWVIVFSSFVISLIADGISFSFGLLYIEFLNYFQESNSKTSWIGSLFLAVPLLSGPIMSALVDRYGCKYMTMIGGFISGLGFVIASMGHSIEWEFAFFGVVAGLGLGVCYVTAVVSICYWFDKYRTLAIGLGACGTGIGTFIYAPLTQSFIENYGWRGTVLLLGGTFFNISVCGALMRDPEWLTFEQGKQTGKTLETVPSCESLNNTKDEFFNGNASDGFSGDLKSQRLNFEKSSNEMAAETDNSDFPLAIRSTINLPTFIKQKEKKSSAKVNGTSTENRMSPEEFRKQLPNGRTAIRLNRNSALPKGGMLNVSRYRLGAASCPDIFRNSIPDINKENDEKWYSNALDLLKTMFDFSMFVELHFFLMSLATILLFMWLIVPYFYLAEHVIRHGYTDVEGSFLLSIIGMANCFGMVGLGWAGDRPWVNVTKTYALCLILCGLSCLLIPVTISNYVGLSFLSALFGLFFASNYSFTPSIVVQLIPLERFTTAYGLILLCQGIGSLIGPPLAGWIFDVTGDWNFSFYLAGAWIIFTALLIILIEYTQNRRIWGSGQLEMEKITRRPTNN